MFREMLQDSMRPKEVMCSNEPTSFEELTRNFIETNLKSSKVNKHGKVKTKKKNTAFGTICFQGFGQKSHADAPYVKVSAIPSGDPNYSEIAKHAWTLMTDCWKIPKPKLIISVTGGARRFEMSNRLRTSFKRGLMKAAMSADAWIVTGGTKTGVMEIVGEAVNEYRLQTGSLQQQIVLIGIASWGIVAGKTNLESKSGNGCFPCDYNFQNIMKGKLGKSALLDPNHTHFFLVDDNTVDVFGAEIAFRAAFEGLKTTDPVPVVLLMLEGGLNTVKTVCEAMEPPHNTPIVIIEGSGRAADFIAAASRLTGSDKHGETKHSQEQWEDLWQKWKHPSPTEAEKKEIIKNVRKILDIKNKRLITIIKHENEGSGQEIDKAIINAIIKAKDSDVRNQLELALIWNRCDIAKQEIFNPSQMKWKNFDLDNAMFSALVQDKDEFVDLFIDNGVDIKKFLTIPRLYELYKTVLEESSEPGVLLLKHLILLEQQKSWWTCSEAKNRDLHYEPDFLKVIGSVINNLSKDQRENVYTSPEYLVSPMGYDWRKISNKNVLEDTIDSDYKIVKKKKKINDQNGSSSTAQNAVSSDVEDEDEPPDETKNEFEYPARELFLWSVLMNRNKMAKIFWKLGEDHISGALTASMLTAALAEAATSEEELDLAQELTNNAQEFEMLAVGILNECYQKDKEMSHDLLIRNLDQWGNKTLFVLADTGEQMDFMQHTCCQTKLNRNWKGKMALDTPIWKIVIGLLFQFLIVPSIKFTSYGRSDEVYMNSKVKPVTNLNTTSFSERDVTKKKRRITRINFFKSILYYNTAPVVKFCYHTISYLVFLGLFSFFMLTNFYPYHPSIAECIIWGWVVTMWFEELRQIHAMEPQTFANKFAAYISSNWNKFDLFIDILFIICVVLRLTLDETNFSWARMMYSLTLSFYYLRFLQVFYVEKNIGPKVIMIRQMFNDLGLFILILSVFILSYGVSTHVLLYPNSGNKGWLILKDVLQRPYFHIYGDMDLNELQGIVAGCSSNETIYNSDLGIPRCPENSWMVMVIFSIFLMLTNILLINLLIAMFSYTFGNVQENSEKVWRFYRYGLVKEYFIKPTLAPPLIIFSHLWRIGKACRRRCTHTEDHNDFSRKFTKDENRQYAEFEKACMYTYFLQLKSGLKGKDILEYKLTTTGQKIDRMAVDIECLKENVQSFSCGASGTAGESPAQSNLPAATSCEPDHDLRREVKQLRQQMEEVLNALKSNSSHQTPVSTRPIRPAQPVVGIQNITIRDNDYGNINQV